MLLQRRRRRRRRVSRGICDTVSKFWAAERKRASCFLAQTDDTCSFITLTVATVDGRRRLFKTTSLQITWPCWSYRWLSSGRLRRSVLRVSLTRTVSPLRFIRANSENKALMMHIGIKLSCKRLMDVSFGCFLSETFLLWHWFLVFSLNVDAAVLNPKSKI